MVCITVPLHVCLYSLYGNQFKVLTIICLFQTQTLVCCCISLKFMGPVFNWKPCELVNSFSSYLSLFDLCRRFLQQDFDSTLAFVNHERKQRTEVCLIVYFSKSKLKGKTIRKMVWIFPMLVQSFQLLPVSIKWLHELIHYYTQVSSIINL